MIFVGCDNGVSGSVGIVSDTGFIAYSFPTPVRKELNYTKKKGWIHRVDYARLRSMLSEAIGSFGDGQDVRVFMERPMVNPMRFAASVSALRAFEATVLVFESLGLSYEYIDSKEWQAEMLPRKVGKDELKKASLSVGKRLFPKLTFTADADGILIAEYAKRLMTNGLRGTNAKKERKRSKGEGTVQAAGK